MGQDIQYTSRNHIFNTPRSRSITGDAKTGPELLENRSRQPLRHDVGELLRRRDVEDPDAPRSHLLTNEVYVELNMLRSMMMDRVGGEVNGGDVVAVDERSLVNITKQLLEQLTEPRAFRNGVSHCSSALERETVGCCLEDQEIRDGPRYTQYPEVERRVPGQLAQSASE